MKNEKISNWEKKVPKSKLANLKNFQIMHKACINKSLFLRNPGFPSASTSLSSCNYNIQKSDPGIANIEKCEKRKMHHFSLGVCSLRLDFESFNLLAGTSTVEETGFACQDEFSVAGLGTGQRIPIICGANNGQHSTWLKSFLIILKSSLKTS